MIKFDEEGRLENVKILRAKEEEGIAQMLAEKYDVQYVNLVNNEKPIDPEALTLIEESVAREANTVAFLISGKRVEIATTSPNDKKTLAIIDKLKRRGFAVVVYLASGASIKKVLSAYSHVSKTKPTRAGILSISQQNVLRYADSIRSTEDLRRVVSDILTSHSPYYTTEILEAIIAGALSLKASDLHVEPEGDGGALLRFRLDGLLYDVLTVDAKTFAHILSRIKLISGLKINVKNSPQDGRFTISLHEKNIEIRTSVLPGKDGESVVLRVLNPDAISVPLEDLGIHPSLIELVKQELQKPNGMILNTGPTGSGKTTTLYAFLKYIKSPEVKIITIEDPVEYRLPGIVQTQVSKRSPSAGGDHHGSAEDGSQPTAKQGLSFAEGLRSIVRQDPDVIMVGEIRDAETAEIAIQAALTGHLVFSTLHTNTAAATFSRLIDLEADPKTVGAALNVAMAQRLVRKLCEHCRKEVPLEEKDKKVLSDLVAKVPASIERKEAQTHFLPVGCEKCSRRGYAGRIGIFEIVFVDEKLEELLHEKENPSQREILEVAKHQGFLSMQEDAALKILNGTTSLEEVRRVIEL
jgi:type IV pilus assembly protein PilB